MEPQDIANLAQTLDIQQDAISAELGPHWWPRRGLGPMPPNDPVLYRLFEVRAKCIHTRFYMADLRVQFW